MIVYLGDSKMKMYKVKVNGKIYIVEIEEITGEVPQLNPEAAPAAEPAMNPTPQIQPISMEPTAPPVPPDPTPDVTVVTCPMPGSIMEIQVSVGARVKEGDVLLILEAMKMENEIMAPKGGVISRIPVTVGESVETGDTLIVITNH
jgi:glutaconyl-CoA decarboxylase